MRKSTFKYIEQEIEYFHESKEMIKELERDIIFSNPGGDENVGGGRSSVVTSPIESFVIKIDSSQKLMNLKKNVAAIEKVYNESSEPYQKLMHMKYWSKKKYTWSGIAAKLYVSERSCYYMKKKIIENVADLLGLV